MATVINEIGGGESPSATEYKQPNPVEYIIDLN